MSKSKPEVAVVVEPAKYAGIMDRAVANAAAESPVILRSVNPAKTPKEGTARAAALAALMASIGQPRPAVLAAVAQAERDWHHKVKGVAPKAVSPVGWLKTFNASFI